MRGPGGRESCRVAWLFEPLCVGDGPSGLPKWPPRCLNVAPKGKNVPECGPWFMPEELYNHSTMPTAKTTSSTKSGSTRVRPRTAKGTKTALGRSRPAAAPPSKRVTKAGFENYSAAVKWLMDRVNVERLRPTRVDPKAFKLERMKKLMALMGDPQTELRAVHVAGTNGKGSTIAMIGSCLRESGYTEGTYSSPHLVDLRERIQVNGKPISHHAITNILGEVAFAAQKLEKTTKLGPITFFEAMTAAAFVHFAEQAVDVALFETGLGGRLDATNVLTPEVTAVTGIAMDHTVFLGDSLDMIAREKAGIFKRDVPALTFKQDAQILDAMREVAEEVGAAFEVLGDQIEFSSRFEATPHLGPHMRVGLTTKNHNYEHIPVPLPGEHQARNCGLALAVIDKLRERGFDLPDMKIIDGLANAHIPGRMELLKGEPRILLDGAHNPTAMNALVKAIGAHVSYDSMIMIFGCAADKDMDLMLEEVARGADKVIFTRSQKNPRAADQEELVQRFSAQSPNKMYQVAKNLEEALQLAKLAAGRDDLICITGSFYLVGEAKKMLSLREKAAAVASTSN